MAKAKQAVKTPATPAPAAPAPAAPVVALRGGLAVAAVRLTGKAYRTAAAHNRDWYAAVTGAVTAGGGTATVAALLEAKVPSHFVGYCIRRGYLATVEQPATQA